MKKTVEFIKEPEDNNIFTACGMPEHKEKHHGPLGRIVQRSIFEESYTNSDGVRDVVLLSRTILGNDDDSPITDTEILPALLGFLYGCAKEDAENTMRRIVEDPLNGMKKMFEKLKEERQKTL